MSDEMAITDEMAMLLKLCKHLGVEVEKTETKASVHHRNNAACIGLDVPKQYAYEIKGGGELKKG